MHDGEIYSKTAAGRNEIPMRQHRLTPAMRSILLLVDGQRSVAQLRTIAATLRAPPDTLERLAGLGLIGTGAAATPGEPSAPPSAVAVRYSTLSGLMSEAVREHLGLRGFFMQLKIEKCDDVDELLMLLPDVTAAVAKAASVEAARDWERLVRAAVKA